MNKLIVITIALFIASCARSTITDLGKLAHYNSEGENYSFAWCFGDFATYTSEATIDDIDTITCCYSPIDLYEALNLQGISKSDFFHSLYELSVSNQPMIIPPDIYKQLSSEIIIPDSGIQMTYNSEGIEGVLRLLSSSNLTEQYVSNPDQFRYIAFLLWNHGIYITEHMGCEFPSFDWKLSGDEVLIHKYFKSNIVE